MKDSIRELAETVTTDIRGTAISSRYGLQPIQFLKEIQDAAKKQLFFGNFVKVLYAPKNTHDVMIPKRTTYEGRSGVTSNFAGTDTFAGVATHVTGDYSTTTGVGPYHNTIAAISWTSMDNLDNVIATPLPVIGGYALRRFDIETNTVNLVEAAKEELTYYIGDRVDRAIAMKIGDATKAGDTTLGAQTLFGGDATGADSLATGDVITTDLVAKAKRYLQQLDMYQRGTAAASGAETKCTSTKNPWGNTNDDPFVFFIGPAQEETFLKDSQFVNAAEYGSGIIVQNGEIGMYLGIRVVVTTNVESTAAGGTAPDATTATPDCTQCIMCKAKAACALVWGKDPEIRVFNEDTYDQIRIGIYTAYDVVVIHPDAIVLVLVSDS